MVYVVIMLLNVAIDTSCKFNMGIHASNTPNVGFQASCHTNMVLKTLYQYDIGYSIPFMLNVGLLASYVSNMDPLASHMLNMGRYFPKIAYIRTPSPLYPNLAPSSLHRCNVDPLGSSFYRHHLIIYILLLSTFG